MPLINRSLRPLSRSLQVARDAIAEGKLDLVYYTDIGMEPLTYFLAFVRLARIQCVTRGHPQTTGIPTVDYFISSELCEPRVTHGEAHYSEQLACLPIMGNWIRRPKRPEAASRDTLGLPTAAHLYGCLQSVFKLQPDFDAILGDILRRDTDARIVLLEGHKPYWTELFKPNSPYTMHSGLPSGKSAAHVVANTDVTVEPCKCPNEPARQLAGIERRQQHVGPGVRAEIDRFHRHMHNQFVAIRARG